MGIWWHEARAQLCEMLVSWKCDYLTMYGLVVFVFCLVEVSSTGHPDTGVVEALFVEATGFLVP